MIIKAFRYCVLFFFLSKQIIAQNISFTASVNNTTVAAGEQFQLTFSVNGNGTKFQAPTFRDFSVLMGPSQSMSTQIINGSFSQSISYTYVLIAQKEGAFEIGPASIEVDGKKYQSNSLKITVVKGNAPQQQSRSGNQGGAQQSSGGLDAGSVYIRAFVDRTNVMQGEAITVTYKLCTRLNLVSYNLLKLPAFTGFWSEDISVPQQLQFTRQMIDGVQYSVADIKKVVLYPQRSGTLSVEPMEGEVIARIQTKRQQSNNPFDQFFNDPFFNNSIRDVKYPIKSETVKINVRELPAPPAGNIFNGAVGKFTRDIILDKKETITNEPLTLKIKFSGKGNIKLIDAPQIQTPPDIEAYDPKVSENISPAPGGASGYKTFEYLLIPRKAGEFKIPVEAFCYYDLDKKNYVQSPATELIIKVGRGTESGAATVTGVSKEDVRMLGKDIRFIKTNSFQSSSRGVNFLSPGFFTLQAVPFALMLLILVARRKQIQRQSNVVLMRRRKADSVARKRLKLAKKFLDANDKQKFLDEMFRALWGFASDKLGVQVADLTRDKIREELTSRKVNEEIINSFGETVDACEYARFAPTDESNPLSNIYESGIRVITAMDKVLEQ
jgi:hypothetical protein